MNQYILVELTFPQTLRRFLPAMGYMAHLVVKDGSEYLGVKFVDGEPVFGKPGIFRLFLMYEGVDYSPLIPGVEITVREGAKIVAHGRVLEDRGMV